MCEVYLLVCRLSLLLQSNVKPLYIANYQKLNNNNQHQAKSIARWPVIVWIKLQHTKAHGNTCMCQDEVCALQN